MPKKRNQPPNQRTLGWLRSQGYTTAVVEKWNAHAKIRQDLYGFIDVLAYNEFRTLAVQCTSHGNFAGHLEALKRDDRGLIARWLALPNRELMLISWVIPAERNRWLGKGTKWHPNFIVFDRPEDVDAF